MSCRPTMTPCRKKRGVPLGKGDKCRNSMLRPLPQAEHTDGPRYTVGTACGSGRPHRLPPVLAQSDDFDAALISFQPIATIKNLALCTMKVGRKVPLGRQWTAPWTRPLD